MKWNFALKIAKKVSHEPSNTTNSEMLAKTSKFTKTSTVKFHQNIIVEDDPTEPKTYMKQKSLSDSRLIFRLRTEMVDVKDNMRNKYKGSSVHCDACRNQSLRFMSWPALAMKTCGQART